MRTLEDVRMDALKRQQREISKIMRPPDLRIVTLQDADEWVRNTEELKGEKLFKQRTTGKDPVERIARQIIHDSFIPTHQGIALTTVNKKKVCKDGCHRLQAVLLAGVPVLMWVWDEVPQTITNSRGEEIQVMETIDRGRVRSVGNQLEITYGFKNSTAWASHLIGIVEFVIGRIPPPEVKEVKGVYDIYRKHSEAILDVEPNAASHNTKLWSILALYHAVNPSGAIDLATQVLRKEGLLKSGYPGHTLNKFLEQRHNKKKVNLPGYSSVITYMDYCATACFAHNDNSQVARLSARQESREWLREGQASKQRVLNGMFARLEYTNVAAEIKK